MEYTKYFEEIAKFVNRKNLKLMEPLSKHTTVRIGGPADIFFTPKTRDELLIGIKKCREFDIPVTMLGWGANTLISDKGIRGVVIRSHVKNIEIAGRTKKTKPSEITSNLSPRWNSYGDESVKKLYEFKDLDYQESHFPRVSVKMDAGVDLPYAISFTISKGITGLQWYSRIPGTIGGSIFNNIHGGTHYISEVVESVEIMNRSGEILHLNKDELEFDYDYSRFHRTDEIILSAKFCLYEGDTNKARYVAMEWAKRKSIQPSNSLGCVFRNLSEEEKEKFSLPTSSFGYVIEHILKLDGFRIGDAMISSKHKAFIENVGKATSKDYLSVMLEVKKRAKTELGIDVKPEIVFLGDFDETPF
ncbi:FAD-binding protein [Candidatus Dojkabacteria bacterium]|uniref:UDP-N-acetylenolpyruvoylglucosamine reductase n=1 Tax=Candidatus Dojkabacteria bacterium TaxID=2099670 RepID=A0A3M0Z061_9BACT|nr:MAG: FAD-binding protein [Candidatus Dojkabacteria bacterium]